LSFLLGQLTFNCFFYAFSSAQSFDQEGCPDGKGKKHDDQLHHADAGKGNRQCGEEGKDQQDAGEGGNHPAPLVFVVVKHHAYADHQGQKQEGEATAAHAQHSQKTAAYSNMLKYKEQAAKYTGQTAETIPFTLKTSAFRGTNLTM